MVRGAAFLYVREFMRLFAFRCARAVEVGITVGIIA